MKTKRGLGGQVDYALFSSTHTDQLDQTYFYFQFTKHERKGLLEKKGSTRIPPSNRLLTVCVPCA